MDLHLLELAHAGAPWRGVRVTAQRGKWAKDGIWRDFERSVTITGYVSLLEDDDVELQHGNLTAWIRLADVEYVDGRVSLSELARRPSLEQALALRAAV